MLLFELVVLLRKLLVLLVEGIEGVAEVGLEFDDFPVELDGFSEVGQIAEDLVVGHFELGDFLEVLVLIRQVLRQDLLVGLV